MRTLARRHVLGIAGALLGACAITLGMTAAASAHNRHHDPRRKHGHSAGARFTARVVFNGATIMHPITGGSEPISGPDDITYLDGHIFVGFQDGVGPQGEASSSGNLDSTIVEFTPAGHEVAQWDVTGKCDGLTADPYTGQVIATVNEDANSSVYLIDPRPGSTPVHYQYDEPLPHNGGTDAIEIYHGVVLISASAPGTTGAAAPEAGYPAVYVVHFDPLNHIAYVEGLFGDEDPAVVANVNAPNFGSTVNLALTDPDSNEVVPSYADRFAGDFMLTSQGDEQQIFYSNWRNPLSVLQLTASVDDTAWPSASDGTLYTTSNGSDEVIAVTGPFQRGSEIAAVTPCDENSAPATCPGPGYPPNYLGQINPRTGVITALNVSGPGFQPQGMLFLGDSDHAGW